MLVIKQRKRKLALLSIILTISIVLCGNVFALEENADIQTLPEEQFLPEDGVNFAVTPCALATYTEKESNNTAATANAVTPDISVNGKISTGPDWDFFKFSFGSTTGVDVKLQMPATLDLNITIFEGTTITLKSSNNYGKGVTENLKFLAKANTTYYVKVAGNSSNYSSTLSYSLNLTKCDVYSTLGWKYMYDNMDFTNISSGYKLSDRPDHYGFDIIHKAGTTEIYGQPIKSVCSGKVVYRNTTASAGNHVVIESDNYIANTTTKLRVGYMHMKDAASVALGTTIPAGKVLGYTGNTGSVYPLPTPAAPKAG